jgi:hypothetical protein
MDISLAASKASSTGSITQPRASLKTDTFSTVNCGFIVVEGNAVTLLRQLH